MECNQHYLSVFNTNHPDMKFLISFALLAVAAAIPQPAPVELPAPALPSVANIEAVELRLRELNSMGHQVDSEVAENVAAEDVPASPVQVVQELPEIAPSPVKFVDAPQEVAAVNAEAVKVVEFPEVNASPVKVVDSPINAESAAEVVKVVEALPAIEAVEIAPSNEASPIVVEAVKVVDSIPESKNFEASPVKFVDSIASGAEKVIVVESIEPNMFVPVAPSELESIRVVELPPFVPSVAMPAVAPGPMPYPMHIYGPVLRAL